jgi:deazaflavin-dependent oxidoreductase (nitroreductase family)
MLKRSAFRLFVVLHALVYRVTGARYGGTVRGLRVLLLTTTGRKSGRTRTTPLTYFEDGGGCVITGSNGGSPAHPAWFLNLRSNPHATIQIGEERIDVRAEIVGAERRAQLWAALIKIAPFYARYAKRTRREIPLVVLRPDTERQQRRVPSA